MNNPVGNPIPEKIVAFQMYNEGEKLVGITGEVELPEFESMTSTISGPGILGEVESPNVGHFGSQQLTIPFRVLSKEAMALYEPKGQTITLRADHQSFDVANGKIAHRSLKIVVRGIPKGLKPGKLAAGNGTESEVTLELYYIKIELDNFTLLELDKYNSIFIVNGKDYLEDVRNNI